ncbi:MAG: hypothetical protein RLY86_3539 [Pseudomonadota bacterium]|jgi:hypothetical protein
MDVAAPAVEGLRSGFSGVWGVGGLDTKGTKITKRPTVGAVLL